MTKIGYSRPWSVLRYMLPVTNSTVQGSVETTLTPEQWDELMEGLRREVEYVLRNKQNT